MTENPEIQAKLEELMTRVVDLEAGDQQDAGLVILELERLAVHLQQAHPLGARLAACLAAAADNTAMAMHPQQNSLSWQVVLQGLVLLQRLQVCGKPEKPEDLALLKEIGQLAKGARRGGPGRELCPEMLVVLGEEQTGEPDPLPEYPDEEEEEEETLPVEESAAAHSALPATEPVSAPTSAEQEGETAPTDVERLIEEVSQHVMMADLNDLHTLGTLCSTLEQLTAQLAPERPLASALAQSLNAVVEKIILEELDPETDPLAAVARGTSLIQHLQLSWTRLGKEVAEDPELLAELSELSGVALSPLGVGAPAPAAGTPVILQEVPAVELSAPSPVHQATDLSAIDADILVDFISEAEEHLSAAEHTLLSLETNPTDAELINTVFRAFHTIKGGSGFLNLHEITRVAHCIEDILDSARKGQLLLSPSILDVVLEATDLLKNLLRGIGEASQGKEVSLPDIGPFLSRVAARGKGAPAPAPASAVEQEAPVVPVVVPSAEAVHPQERAANPEAGQRQRDQHFVRVNTDKLDQLVNMVGELVITQTQVSQSPVIRNVGNQKLGKDISQLSKISKDIQEIAMALRMVPIRGTFERMARTVRDLARKCGKEVELQVAGEDTELDKNVVEELVDPLTHMVRNAVDHGIDSPEDRRAAGKPERGQVKLEAYHKGGNIVIELKDDGRGLNVDKIRRKAVERGLVHPSQELSEQEVFALVFQAGFSTADQISDISGRGVGMDVVKRSIEKLHGKIDVASTAGQGSTFTIRLPLTLAIIDGMVISVGGQRYILPLTSIVRSVRPRPEEIYTVLGKGEMVAVQGELYPLIRVYQRFGLSAIHQDPSESLVVVVEAEGRRYCLLVDELLGMQQVVIKALEQELRGDHCLAGCAILGDGKVGLILDPNGLVASNNGHVFHESTAANGNGKGLHGPALVELTA